MAVWLKAYLLAALLAVFAVVSAMLWPGGILQGALFTAAVVLAIMGTIGLLVEKFENKGDRR